MKRGAWPRAFPFMDPAAERERRMRARAESARAGIRGSAGTYAGATTGPAPKDNVLVSAAYENAVRDLGYCMRCRWRGRPHFCHRDEGKGAGIKTDVREGWPGCPQCHALLGGHDGTTRLPKELRRAEELGLGVLTRRALRAAGTWPKSVPLWEN